MDCKQSEESQYFFRITIGIIFPLIGAIKKLPNTNNDENQKNNQERRITNYFYRTVADIFFRLKNVRKSLVVSPPNPRVQ